MNARPAVPGGAERRQSPALSGPDELGGRCGSCDCDPELLDPWLLAQWLRSVPDRHAEVFNQARSGRDAMRDHPWPGAWSASQYLVHVAQVAEVTAEGVVRLFADAPAGDVTQKAPEAPGGSRSRPLPAAVLASLGASIEQLASAAELIASDDWLIGIRRHGELPALELIRLALHEATHHLVEAAQVLEQVRPRPSAPPVAPQASTAGEDGHAHLVEFYETEEFLVETVSGFVGPALHDGDAAIVVATAAHRAAFDDALRSSGVDLGVAVSSGRYLTFDAAEILSTFMVGGTPDGRRFADTIGAVIEQAGAGGRRVQVYGEMVALLWDAGDIP